MSHDKSPIAQAVDLVFFAPLGLALAAKEAFPGWAVKGRQRIVHDVEVARMVGEHATRHGHKVVAETLVGLGVLPGPPPPPASRPVHSRARATSHSDGRARATALPNGRAADPVAAVAGSVPSSADLAIPGYDSLSASQVVQRLAGLEGQELESVRSYEAVGRGRRTILTKISQLQAGRS